MTQRAFVFLIAQLSLATYLHAAEVKISRLECGLMEIEDISYFSDAHHYDGQAGEATNGCYLISHRQNNIQQYLLWDAGLPAELVLKARDDGDGWRSSLPLTILAQLVKANLQASDITYLGLSHYHGDHIGQAVAFPEATLLIGQKDAEYLGSRPAGNAVKRLSPWFKKDAKRIEIQADHDVFQDGSVTVLALPGHTPGHQGLLVRLSSGKSVLLSGDLYHFNAEIGQEIVSRWNPDRAATLASQKRFESIIKNLKPIVVIQHDRKDIARIPAFPEFMD